MNSIDFYGFMSDEQREALKFLQTGQNVFITGGAGTGKSFLLKYIRDLFINVMFVAPTGIAASNINGQTIHSFFKIRPQNYYKRGVNYSSEPDNKLFRLMQILVIDEVSMLRVDLLMAIDVILRQARKSHLPFGGVTILAVGDFFQLPPIVSSKSEKKMLSIEYKNNYAFNAPVWQELDFKIINLTKNFRQKDSEFLSLLNNLRVGNYGLINCLDALRGMTSIVDELNSLIRTSNKIPDDTLCLCMNKKDVKKVNRQQEQKNLSQQFLFEAQINGDFPKKDYPTNKKLKLKVGSKVMLLKNDLQQGYTNGDIGIVTEIDPERRIVVLELISRPEINGQIVYVGENTWECRKEVEVPEEALPAAYQEQVVGSFRQVALKLAHAITVHKSQGFTLDKLHINIDSRPFSFHQIYVALSRVRSHEHLTLSRPLNYADLLVDPVVQRAYLENFNKKAEIA